jgi:hypothetical protein
MKKLKDEKELVKKAIALGVEYGEKRGAVEFEATDSANDKLEYIYRLLVHDKLLNPIPEIEISQKTIRHKLAIWASKQNNGVKPLLDAYLELNK